MKRTILEQEHRMFRDAFRRFAEQEIAPHHEQWEKDGVVSKEVWRKAGQQGFLCMDVDEEYGGGGILDFRYNAIVGEELARINAGGVGFPIHTDMVVPYITRVGNDEQKRRWLPALVSGECISAVAMTEPNTGSDLAAVRTTAIRDGDHYVVNGQKTFISNGILNDLVVAAVRTNADAGRHDGISLLVIEGGTEGYERGRNLDKVGLHAQDTAELFFKDAHVPVENLLGEEGQGFIYLMQGLPRERLIIAAGSLAAAEAALEWTIQYCQERHAFGQPIGKFQNSRFKLAEMKTEIQIGRVFVDRCIMELSDDNLSVEDAAMAKWWITELLKRVVDTCVQLHGDYGYMMEYPIAKAYIDARVQTIVGGTTEIMKNLIGKAMGF